MAAGLFTRVSLCQCVFFGKGKEGSRGERLLKMNIHLGGKRRLFGNIRGIQGLVLVIGGGENKWMMGRRKGKKKKKKRGFGN